MVNYKSKYLKYKLKYEKLTGGGPCGIGEEKCKEKYVTDDIDNIDESRNISINVIFKGVDDDKIYKFNINPMKTVRDLLSDILRLHTHQHAYVKDIINELSMSFADEPLDHNTILNKSDIKEEATIEIYGAREFILNRRNNY